MNSNGFTYRYAIRRPDGELILRPKTSEMWGFLVGGSGGADEERLIRTWETREAAESALKDIRKQAAEMGIGQWLGVIVQQLCTPFTLHDPAEHFAEEVQDWLNERSNG